MQSENQLILELCKFVAPNQAQIEKELEACRDIPHVLGELLCNRMGGVAYGVLRDCGLLGKVNREVRNTLKSIYDVSCIRAESYLSALTLLSETLRDVSVPYAVLKGAVLLDKYPLGYRTSNDIDLLLASADVSAVSDRLEEAGFCQGYLKNGVFRAATRAEIVYSRMNRGETVPYIRRVDLPFMEYMEVDLNFSLDYKPSDGETVRRMLAQRRRMDNGLWSLDDSMFILHLCAHLYKEATTLAWVEMERDLSLYKFADLYLLLHTLDTASCRSLAHTATALGLEREFIYAVAGTMQLFDIRHDDFDRLITEFLEKQPNALNEVIDPAKGKRYVYDFDFASRVFCHSRAEHLKEVGDLGASAYV